MIADYNSLLIYWGALFITLILCGKFSSWGRAKGIGYQIFLIILICLPLSLVAGLRKDVGTDWNNYLEAYNRIRWYSWGDIFTAINEHEPGFMALYKIIYIASGGNTFAFFFVIEFITLFFTVLGFSNLKKQFSINLPFAFFLYYLIYYHPSFNIMRQCLSVSIIIWGFSFLLNRKFLLYLAISILAFLFHRSAIITIVYPLSYLFLSKRDSKTNVFFNIQYFILIGLFALTLNYIVSTVLSFDFFISRYDSYDINMSSNIGYGQLFVFFYSIVPIFYLGRDIIKRTDKLLFLYYVAILYLPISVIGYYAEHVSRMNMYGQISFLIITILLGSIPGKGRYIRYYSIAVYTITYAISILIINNHHTFPYII